MSPSGLLINLAFLLRRPTGTSIYALNLLPHLSKLAPTLLVSREYITAPPKALPPFKCYPIPAGQTSEQGLKGHLRRLLWTQLQLPQVYRQLKAQLLFSPLPEVPLFTSCRSVVMVHDLIPLRFPKPFSPLTPYFRAYIPQVLAQADHIICNSTATARDLTDFLGIPAQKITPILLAYDANHFRKLKAVQPAQSKPYFLYLGRHDRYKNVSRLIAAFASLANSGDYELWLAGSPDRRYTPQLQAQVQELGLSDRVRFLDYLPYEQLPTALNQALALVFPSLWEGFGLPVLEAMACGTPVITSNLSSLPEVAGDAALLVDPYKTEAIAAAMQTVAQDGTLRSRLSELGVQQASQFSWAKTGQATLEVLERYL